MLTTIKLAAGLLLAGVVAGVPVVLPWAGSAALIKAAPGSADMVPLICHNIGKQTYHIIEFREFAHRQWHEKQHMSQHCSPAVEHKIWMCR
jgi:hypothetical protein